MYKKKPARCDIYINHSIDCIEKIAPIAKINSWSLYVFNYKQR